MKRLFTQMLAIVSLMLISICANAEGTVLLNYTISSQDAATGTYTAGNGKVTINKAATETSTGSNVYMVSLDKGTGKYIKLVLAEGETFKEGDVITFNANTTAGTPSESKQMGLVLCTQAESSGDSYFDIAGGYANLSVKTTREDIACTIAQNSSLIGKNEIYVYRQSSGTVNIYSVSVTRPESGPQENEAPAITTQPISKTAEVGQSVSLSVAASGYPTPTVQWYSNTTASNENGTLLTGKVGNTLEISTAEVGTFYYYAVATNNYGDEDHKAVSNVVTVTITEAATKAPTFTVLGHTVQMSTASTGAKIYYALNDADLKISGSKTEYTGTFIPESSGTIYAYADMNGLLSDVTSVVYNKPVVGDVIGEKLATMQPESHTSDSNYSSNTYENDGYTLVSTATLTNSGRGSYVKHFKTSGTITVTAPTGYAIQSIKVIGTSNDGSKVSTITPNSGATAISTPSELMQRDVVVDGNQTMSEVVLTVDNPTSGNSVSFALGRESRMYVEVYGVEIPSSVSVPVNYTGISSFCSDVALDFTDVEGIEAYAVTEIGATSVTLTKVVKVAAGEGIFVKGTTTDVPVATETVEKNEDNLLVGTTAATTVGENFYALSASDGMLHPVTAGGTIAKGKAYLVIEGAAASKGALSLSFGGEATASEAQVAETVQANGKYVEDGQLVIVANGKKFNVAGIRK